MSSISHMEFYLGTEVCPLSDKSKSTSTVGSIKNNVIAGLCHLTHTEHPLTFKYFAHWVRNRYQLYSIKEI